MNCSPDSGLTRTQLEATLVLCIWVSVCLYAVYASMCSSLWPHRLPCQEREAEHTQMRGLERILHRREK